MTNGFPLSLFTFKRWLNMELYRALCELSAENRAEILPSIFTLDHAMRVDRLFRARLEGAPEPYDTVVARSIPDLEALARATAETDDWYVDYVRTVTDAELEKPIAFTFVSDGDAGYMTRGQMLAHVLTHSQSHRGGVGAMLANQGVKLPSDMFTSYVSMNRPKT